MNGPDHRSEHPATTRPVGRGPAGSRPLPPYAGRVEPTVAAWLAAVAALAGLGAGAVAVLVATRRATATGSEPVGPRSELPHGVTQVLRVLGTITVVVDAADAVVQASPTAHAFGLVRGDRVAHRELLDLVRHVREDGGVREVELELPRGPLGTGRIVAGARVAPLGERHVLMLVTDRTESRRVEEVRRDFAVNVSHELKTPVGAISLLAETIAESADDAAAVRRFAGRMGRETERLTALVREIIELSRLQGSDGLERPELVDVDAVVREAVDRSRLVADTRRVELATGGDCGARVYGDRDLLVTAVRNLVDNGVRYSDEGTRVGIGVRAQAGLVEVAVADQGIGIPAADLDRVFERFYRVDAARSRATGGTGLGLSIVKHVAANHGGDVTVWSQPGQGSTFTLRLPDADLAAPPDTGPDAVSDAATALPGPVEPQHTAQPEQPAQPAVPRGDRP